MTFQTPETSDDDMSTYGECDTNTSILDTEILDLIKERINYIWNINKKIDITELFMLLYTQVALDTGIVVPLNLRQCLIPFHLQNEVRKIIASRLITETFGLAPIETKSNYPLVAVLKKDDNGGYI